MKKYILLILTMFLSCSDFSQDNKIETKKDIPDHQSWNSTIVISRNGLNRAIVKSGHLWKFNNKQLTFMDQQVHVDFFDKFGVNTSHLLCKRAEVDEIKNNLYAYGNVVVVSDSGITLYTEQLQWIKDEEKIISDTLVKLVSELDTLTGIGFKSDASLENWVILKPAGVTKRELEEIKKENE